MGAPQIWRRWTWRPSQGGHGGTHDLDPERIGEVIRTLYARETELHGLTAVDTTLLARTTWFLA